MYEAKYLYEDKIKQAFVEAFNSLIENKEEILQGYDEIIQAVTDTSKLDKESNKLKSEIEIVTEMLRKCVEENAHSVLNQEEYEERYKALAARYESIKKDIEEINEKRLERSAKQERIEEFIKILEKSYIILTEFDDELWNAVIEIVKVNSEKDITFVFKDGFELQWNI